MLDADYNIKIGSRYLKRLSDKFNNKLPLIAAGYNAGPHRVDTWSSEYHYLSMDEFIEHIPFKETRNYVKRVSRNYGMYKILYDDGEKLSWLTADLGYRFAEKISYKETWE